MFYVNLFPNGTSSFNSRVKISLIFGNYRNERDATLSGVTHATYWVTGLMTVSA